jgi:hypothetical protein
MLVFIDQAGSLDAWDGTIMHPLLNEANLPPGLSPFGPEALLNIAANGNGSRLYVMFTSSTVPSGIPQHLSPRAGADAWQVLYGFDFDGTALSNPMAIVALQVRSDGHTGGGLTMAGDNTLMFATGDNGDAGEDGRAFTQDPTNHLGKIVRIDVPTGTIEIVAIGMRNVQRLIVDNNGGDPHLIAVDIGGWIAEEIDAMPLDDLLSGACVPITDGDVNPRMAKRAKAPSTSTPMARRSESRRSSRDLCDQSRNSDARVRSSSGQPVPLPVRGLSARSVTFSAILSPDRSTL